MQTARNNVVEMPRRPMLARLLDEAPSWMNEDASLSLLAPPLRHMLEHFQSIRGDRLLPLRQDFDPVRVPQHLGEIYLVHVEPPPRRFRYRLIGTGIAAATGRDPTGRYFDEVHGPDVLADCSRGFEWVTSHRRPLRRFGRCPDRPARGRLGFEELLLPLSRSGESVDVVLGRIAYVRL